MIVMSLGKKRALRVGVAYLRSNKYTFPRGKRGEMESSKDSFPTLPRELIRSDTVGACKNLHSATGF